MFRKSLIALILVMSMVLSFAAAGSCAESKGKLKDTLTLATWEDLATMDPQSSNRASNWMVQRNIFDSLVTELPDGTVEPKLATSWKFIDNVTP